MKIEKLHLSQDKLDINLRFYFILKYLVKLKPKVKEVNQIFEITALGSFNNINNIRDRINEIFNKNSDRFSYINEITLSFKDDIDIEMFCFAIWLYQIKDLLLVESKISSLIYSDKLRDINPLSLEYDKISVLNPYKTRVQGALLALTFFEKLEKKETNIISQDAINIVSKMLGYLLSLKKLGLESNQIFMLMFSESINQSIISDSGFNYEARIKTVLERIGVENIQKIHDIQDKSTEYDFFFKLEGKQYGIGAKRTLRERYKQFIKTSNTTPIDVIIQITLGVDLTEEKAKTMVQHGSYIFVSDEIYQLKSFCKSMKEIYSVNNLNKDTLISLVKDN